MTPSLRIKLNTQPSDDKLPSPRSPRPPAASGGSAERLEVAAREAANMRAAPLLTMGNTTENGVLVKILDKKLIYDNLWIVINLSLLVLPWV